VPAWALLIVSAITLTYVSGAAAKTFLIYLKLVLSVKLSVEQAGGKSKFQTWDGVANLCFLSPG
jgi:hypothetical protein